jgi:ubiquinone/menaquinone biosynthesis C-methylase UbiE
MPLFRRGQPPEALAAAMAGVKMGDRVLLAGAADIRLAAEVATRAGLSGRVALIGRDEADAQTRSAQIEAAGGLAEPLGGSLEATGVAPASFDVAIADGTLDALDADARARTIAECYRVLRPGGRLVWIERAPRRGLFGSRSVENGGTAAREHAMVAAGFRAVRTLGTLGGQVFVEGFT